MLEPSVCREAPAQVQGESCGFLGVGGNKGWASLLAQKVKNLLAVQQTRVQSLGGEDLLEKGMATQSSILVWRIPGQRSLADYSP